MIPWVLTIVYTSNPWGIPQYEYTISSPKIPLFQHIHVTLAPPAPLQAVYLKFALSLHCRISTHISYPYVPPTNLPLLYKGTRDGTVGHYIIKDMYLQYVLPYILP